MMARRARGLLSLLGAMAMLAPARADELPNDDPDAESDNMSLLWTSALDPQRRDPRRAAFGPGCLANAVLSVQQSARKRDRRQKAIDAPRQCDHTHKADDDHGKQVR